MQCQHLVLRTAAEHLVAAEAALNTFLQTVQVVRVEAAHVVASSAYWTVLVFSEPLVAAPPAAARDAAAVEVEPLSFEQEARYAPLRDWQTAQAASDGVPPYVIATNQLLRQIASDSLHLLTVNDLLAPPGMGPKKASGTARPSWRSSVRPTARAMTCSTTRRSALARGDARASGAHSHV